MDRNSGMKFRKLYPNNNLLYLYLFQLNNNCYWSRINEIGFKYENY